MTASDQRRVIVLQYWAGDREAALRLARYISDVQGKPCPEVDFVFAYRGDNEPPDDRTLKQVGRFFNVFTVRSPRSIAGWPAGPWALWFSAVEWLAERPQVKWALTFEADCVPLTRDWLEVLDSEWDRRQNDARMLGCAPLGGVAHLNGNMMMSCDPSFLKWIVRGVTVTGVPSPEGWDTYLFPQFLRWGCAISPAFLSVWQTKSAGVGFYARVRKDGVVFVHGVKDDSLLSQARRALLGTALQF